MNILITPEIRSVCPDFKLAIIECKVQNSQTKQMLWSEMENEIEKISASYQIDEIKNRPAIAATRKMYKLLGKDPNRYRPSAEALCRRIVRQIPVNKVNTLVDIINIVSIRSGFSIGGFDTSKIQGNKLILTIGTDSDLFEAIGRGELNVEGLPLYKDEVGGIGTPTSDNERTKITLDTTDLLIIINAYNGDAGLSEAVGNFIELLTEFAFLKSYELKTI